MVKKYLKCRIAKDSVTFIIDFFLMLFIIFPVTMLHNTIWLAILLPTGIHWVIIQIGIN